MSRRKKRGLTWMELSEESVVEADSVGFDEDHVSRVVRAFQVECLVRPKLLLALGCGVAFGS